jgi:hypothetical protein
MKEFLKKYKWYLVLGLVIGLILAAVWYIFIQSKNNGNTTPLVLTIQEPFSVTTSINYLGDINEVTIPSNIKVYKVTPGDSSSVSNFVSTFYKGDAIQSSQSTTKLWSFSDSTVTFDSQSLLFYLNSSSGVSISGLKISSASDIQLFLKTYFSIVNTQIASRSTISNSQKVEYKGYILFDNNPLGALYLDGYSFDIITDGTKIYSIALLVVPDGSISSYQTMPTMSLVTLLKDSSNPTYIKYLSYDVNYSKQFPIIQASAKLKSVTIKSEGYKYIYLDSTYKYIVPTYEIEGDGSLVDSQGNTYWADTLVYICALDPKYLGPATSQSLDIVQ